MLSPEEVANLNILWTEYFGSNGKARPFGERYDRPVTFYVTTTGSDSGLGTETSPFRTLQKALDFASDIATRHNIKIKMGLGTFAGARCENYIKDTTTRHLYIEGTERPATVATGPTSGTVASLSAVNSTGYSTFQIAGANWPVDGLKGKLIRNDTSGASSHVPVVSNTTNTITFFAITTAFADGNTISLVEPGTIIDTIFTDTFPRITPTTSAAETTTETGALLKIEGVRGTGPTASIPTSNPGLQISNIQFSSASGGCVKITDSSVWLRNCIFTGASTGAQLVISGASEVWLFGSYMGGSSATHVNASNILAGSNKTVSLTRVIIEGGTNGVFGSSRLTASDVVFKNITNGFSPQVTVASLTRVGFDTCTTGISWDQAANYSTGTLPAAIGLNGGFFQSCGTCIKALGPQFTALAKFVSGTSNTLGIEATFGARVGIRSDWGPASTTDISVDGATSTLTAMRALNPQAVVNATFGSVVYTSTFT